MEFTLVGMCFYNPTLAVDGDICYLYTESSTNPLALFDWPPALLIGGSATPPDDAEWPRALLIGGRTAPLSSNGWPCQSFTGSSAYPAGTLE